VIIDEEEEIDSSKYEFDEKFNFFYNVLSDDYNIDQYGNHIHKEQEQ